MVWITHHGVRSNFVLAEWKRGLVERGEVGVDKRKRKRDGEKEKNEIVKCRR